MVDTAVVTGASRGIGAAVARELAETGVYVVIAARDREELDAVADDIRAAGGEVEAMRADVRDEYDVERLVETAARVGGDLDLVVASAGVYHGHPGETPIDTESYSTFDDHLRTNARGVFATLREAMPHLARDARVLVPTGSVARDPREGMGSYAVSKACAEAVVRQFAVDTEVTVGCIDPGQVETDLSGDDGLDPEAVAPMFVWAATEVDPSDLDGEVLGLQDWKRTTQQ